MGDPRGRGARGLAAGGAQRGRAEGGAAAVRRPACRPRVSASPRPRAVASGLGHRASTGTWAGMGSARGPDPTQSWVSAGTGGPTGTGGIWGAAGWAGSWWWWWGCWCPRWNQALAQAPRTGSGGSLAPPGSGGTLHPPRSGGSSAPTTFLGRLQLLLWWAQGPGAGSQGGE